MWKDLRILLLGEPKVGKTSLILSLVSEEFAEDVPLRAEEITIPADVTPEKVPTHIVDFSPSVQDSTELCEELARANVVCLVYDLNDADTLKEACHLWLPVIRQSSPKSMPVILVGNKCDLVVESKMDDILPIMNDYPEIETCIECSAKTLKNISEMFYFAQKAVLHPAGPLYCSQTGMIKDECKLALARVFCICDLDKDGYLNNEELSNFQRICFNTPLAPQALQDVKEIIQKGCIGGLDNGKVTLDGFIYLHSLFIQRGRHETTWAALRKFGYSDDLELTDDYLYPPVSEPDPDTLCQLTSDAYRFLEDTFHIHDKDKDGFLSNDELAAVFNVFPYDPWGGDVLSMVHANEEGWISLQGFLAQWTLTAYLDLPRTMEYLAYLGFSSLTGKPSQAEAIEYVPLDAPYEKRKIFSCKVIGHHGVGKSTLLRSLIDRKNAAYDTPVFAINSVQIQGGSKYLLLHEVDISDVMDSEGPLVCDIVCLVYDVSDPESFQECVAFYKQVLSARNTPCVLVASKSDLTAVKQHCAIQPSDFCRSSRFPAPLRFSTREDSNQSDIFKTITSHAARCNSKNVSASYSVRSWLKLCIAAAAIGTVGYVIYKNLSTNSQRFNSAAIA